MKQPLSATAAQVSAFRLDRHHLVAGRRAPLETVCSDVCCIQAQVTQRTALAADVLSAGPLAQQELVERIRPKVSRRVKLWLKYAWSASRPAIVEGLICYGPPRGSEVTLVRTDQWLPPQPEPDE